MLGRIKNISFRFNHVASAYCEDPITERLSVIVPLGELMKDKQEQPCSSNGFSILVKFMCLNSDVGGPNRRPTQVLFTLEDQCCSVLGRDIVNFKVCCCPKRDKAAEERRYLDPSEGERPEESSPPTFIIPSATPTSSTTPATMSQNNIAMVPVHQEDFKKFNEFAEAAWICRDLENADRIKEIRKTLLKEHNQDLLKAIEDRKRKT